MTHAQLAVELKGRGYNCAQAVACAFAEELGMDEETLKAITQTLGGGIGASREGTCGAITGAAVVLGLLGREGEKRENMLRAAELIRRFTAKNGSATCKVLKGLETGVMLRSCPGCVEDAAALVEELRSK